MYNPCKTATFVLYINLSIQLTIMLVKTYSAAVNGLDVTTVTVEVNIVPGVMYRMTGLGDTAVREVATA